jgi:hypothetical protein
VNIRPAGTKLGSEDMSIGDLQKLLGFHEMDNPKSEWNLLRRAGRAIFRKKEFLKDTDGKAYIGWHRADEDKKSSARAAVNHID